MKLDFSPQIKKNSYVKLHENLSSGTRVIPCGRADGWTDMTKFIFAFCNFVNAPKKTMGTFQHLYQFPELKLFILSEG